MDYLKIRNWDKWQTYRKDRGRPPWIKIQLGLLQNLDFLLLDAKRRGELFTLWLIAAERDGEIPNDPKAIQILGRLPSAPDLEYFVKHGFIETCSHMPTTRQPCGNHVVTSGQPVDVTESDTEVETETETETEGVAASVALDGLNLLAWDEYIAYRAESKKSKLKPRTVERQQRWMVQQGSENTQRQIVDETIRNGWTGLFELNAKKGNGKTNPNELLSALEEMNNAG